MAASSSVAAAPAALPVQYRVDDLLTEHFGFAPKAFTGHAFDLINEAVFDTVTAVEEASNAQWPDQPEPVQRALHKLETLLCSAVDKHFDLFEIWLHRNVFDFKPYLKPRVLDHVRLQAQEKVWKGAGPMTEEEWQAKKAEEAKMWQALEAAKADWKKARDDHLALLALSAAYDRRLAALQTASTCLADLTSLATSSSSSSSSNLPSRVQLLTSQLEELIKASVNLRSERPKSLSGSSSRAARKEGFINWATEKKVENGREAAVQEGKEVPRSWDVDQIATEMESHGRENDAKNMLDLL